MLMRDHDLGNADLGYRGSKIKTPTIDLLAKSGVRLESYYGLPVCTVALLWKSGGTALGAASAPR